MMFKLPSARYLLPNFFTLTSTFCGVLIVYLSSRATEPANFYFAALLIPIASILDGFDGRVARWVHGESDIGVQLDSMSDLLVFGVAPAYLLYCWAFERLGVAGVMLGFGFVVCAMLRLARFNVQAEREPSVQRYFRGLPVPMAAMGVATLVCLDTRMLDHPALEGNAFVAVVVSAVLLATLMVSNVPFRTFKDIKRTPADVMLISVSLTVLAYLTYRFDVLTALSTIFSVYFIGNLFFALCRRGWRMTAAGHPVLDSEDEALLGENEADQHLY